MRGEGGRREEREKESASYGDRERQKEVYIEWKDLILLLYA